MNRILFVILHITNRSHDNDHKDLMQTTTQPEKQLMYSAVVEELCQMFVFQLIFLFAMSKSDKLGLYSYCNELL